MAKPNTIQPQRIERSTAGLRETLFHQMERVLEGIASPSEANAIARLSHEVLETNKNELAVHKFWVQLGTKAVKPPPAPPAIDYTKSNSEQESVQS